jgi:iron complex outermembrane receptor protein
MKNYSKLKAGVAPAALGLAMIAMPAFAQDATATPQAAAAEDAAPQQQIIVTGSLIRNPNLTSANPVNVTTSEEIELKQSNLAEEVLREIPGVVANIGSAVNNGNGGSSYVDLRGLGSNRNIVLLDGNRIVPVDFAGRVDLNNIPLALVSRVDSLTGAAVTTYGADAISGVVNFITKKNFSGVDLSVGEAINQKGDGNTARVDLTVGGNFDDGKGNAVLSIGYQKSDPVYQGDRDFSINQVSSFTGGPAGSGTSVPSRFSGTRPIDPLTGQPSINPATANGGTRQINPTTGQAVGTFALFNFNPYNVFQTPFKRYNIYAAANYQVSDSIEVYTRALFSKNTVDTIIAPSGSFGGTVTINLNNPFLPAALRNQFCAFNVGAAGTYVPRFTTAECAAAATASGPASAAYRTVTVALSRRAVEVGPRISDYSTQVFDYRLGLRGSINSHINWDVNGSYGESQKIQTIQNYTLQSRFRQASLSNNGTTCQDTSNGCVPVNIFGDAGTITPAAAAFLSQNSTTQVKTSLVQFRALLSGDVGITSPAAKEPINFALGTEYRKYHAQQASDLLAKTPGELGGAGGAAPDINGGYDTWEAFGELVVPLVSDKPLFKSLTATGGARYARQSVDGTPFKNNAFTYKGELAWEPAAGVKFRGTYAHAVRAPNIGELFSPVSTGLTNLGTDPCAGAAPVANATLKAVCLAQGAPAGTIGSILNPTAAQANSTGGGNPALKPEKANTYTVGVLLQPAVIPHFTLSVDYYRIKVTGVIGTQTPGDAIAACFGNLTAASATNVACTSIRRNPITGGLDGDPATTFGLLQTLNNLGVLYTNGIDVIADWNHQFGKVKYSTHFVGNYTAHSKFNSNPASANPIDRECVGFYSANCASIQPKYQWSLRNTFTYGKVDLSLLWRHINGVKYEPLQATAGGALFVGTAPAGTGPIAGTAVDFNRIPAYNYFDLTARFEVNENFSMTVGASNLFDKTPPIVGNTAGATTYNSGNTYPSTYDALGRRFSVSAHVKF